MIIKSLEIINFLSYYDKNNFQFGDGPTIIIGQNRTGKSKLFDAFHWALYDKAYNTDFEKWDLTKDWKDQIVNSIAKADCKKGETVKASVSLRFEDEEANKYTLTRELKIKKIAENEWESLRNTEVHLNKKEALTNNSKDFFDIEAEDLIKSIFPENLSKYFLFQGENISQIMSLNNKSAFKNALRDLSRIEIFERTKGYTDKVYKQLKKDFENKEDSDKSLQEKKVRLSGEIDRLKSDFQIEEDQFNNYCTERDIAKEIFEKKNEDLKKFEECAKILNDINYLAGQRDNKIELRSSLIEGQKSEIFDTWMYAGSETILKNFVILYEKSKVDKKIPEPIRQDFIRDMLSKEKCLVCDSEAKKGSPQHSKIKQFLNEKSLDKETELINKLSQVTDSTLEKTLNIKVEIQEFYKRISDVDDQIKNINSRIKTKEDELKDVVPSDVSSDEIKKRNFTRLQIDRDNAKGDLDRFEGKISGAKSKMEYINGQIIEKQKEYDALVATSSNKKEKERLQLAEKISEFYENFLTKLIADIEEEANKYFGKMTEKNAALSGKVKVDYDLKEVYTIDESGNRLFNINQANKVSLQISFVGAVLSVSNKFWNTYFPFIADAPISALGGNNKITAVETMITIFNQSIIILKDDAVTDDAQSVRNDLTRKLIQKTSSIENAYELKMVGDKVGKQHTKIEKIK